MLAMIKREVFNYLNYLVPISVNDMRLDFALETRIFD